jgi:hypothetical protein
MAAYVSDAHAVIVQELGRHLRENLSNKKRVAIPCPFHKETQPSLYINLDPHNRGTGIGGYYCFGCRARSSTHGGWNGLANLLGLANVDETQGQVTTYVRREIPVEELHDPDDGWDVEELLQKWNCGFHTPWPTEQNWRGVPGWLVRKIGGWLSLDEQYEQQVCVLPQWNGDVLTGAVKARCRITSKTRLKYISSPGEWVKTHALFPFHTVETMLERREDRSVFLVEGPRDAIRLIGCGLPALALLGTNNWSTEKRDLLMTLGPDRVFVAFDNDGAGQGAYDLVMPTLKDFVHRTRIRFEGAGKIDPGSVPVQQIRDWKTRWGIETTNPRTLPDHY